MIIRLEYVFCTSLGHQIVLVDNHVFCQCTEHVRPKIFFCVRHSITYVFDPNCFLIQIAFCFQQKDFKYTLSVIKCMHQNLQWKTLWNKTSSFCILVDWYVKDHTMGWNYFCRSNLSYIGLKNIWDVIQISIWNSKIKK